MAAVEITHLLKDLRDRDAIEWLPRFFANARGDGNNVMPAVRLRDFNGPVAKGIGESLVSGALALIVTSDDLETRTCRSGYKTP